MQKSRDGATTYARANEASLCSNQEIYSTRMMLREEVARRAEAEEKLADALGDLEMADYQITLLQDGEKEHLDNINKLEKKMKELEERERSCGRRTRTSRASWMTDRTRRFF